MALICPSLSLPGAEARGAAAGALQCLAVNPAAERTIVAAGAVRPLAALCGDAGEDPIEIPA